MKDLLEAEKKQMKQMIALLDCLKKEWKFAKMQQSINLEQARPVLDRQRELDKIATLKTKASDDFYAHGVEELFEQIMAMSRKMQYKLLNEEGVNNDIGFDIVDKLPTEDATVVYQGIPGAYSQQAATEYFGDKVNYVNVTTFREAMKYVRDGKADYAVLPFEILQREL